jgi:cbb3-type cytochrome oxidase maturation protein
VNILTLLIPVTLGLGLLGLAAFFWALRNNQFEDPKGEAERILSDRYDDHPAPDPAADSDEEPRPPADDEGPR